MRAKVVAMFAAGLLIACSNKEPGNQQTAASSADSEAAKVAVAEPYRSGNFYPSPLPGGISVAFPFHFRSDRIYPNNDGKIKRRVVLEIVEGDTAADFESAKQSILAAGYSVSGRHKGDATKKQSQRFTKKGAPTLYLTSNTNVGKKPGNPSATGVVYFDWLVPAARIPAPASPAAEGTTSQPPGNL